MAGGREVYFEFFAVGGQMKVSAIDADTGVEVSAIAPLGTSDADMKALGLAKLERRLSQLSSEATQDTAPKPPKKGRGILV